MCCCGFMNSHSVGGVHTQTGTEQKEEASFFVLIFTVYIWQRLSLKCRKSRKSCSRIFLSQLCSKIRKTWCHLISAKHKLQFLISPSYTCLQRLAFQCFKEGFYPHVTTKAESAIVQSSAFSQFSSQKFKQLNFKCTINE